MRTYLVRLTATKGADVQETRLRYVAGMEERFRDDEVN